MFFLLHVTLAYSEEALNLRDEKPVVLDGKSLTIPQLVQVARYYRLIEIPEEIYETLERSYQLLLVAAEQNIPIYGLNRGVGLNKDRTIFKGKTIDPEVRELSEAFNLNLLRSHSISIGNEASPEVIRACLVARLNTLLRANSGVQPHIVKMYADFLNHEIHPVVPERGSMGEADIGILAHIGLAMAGEGEVIYKGQRMASLQALKAAGLVPIKPFAKDGLAIVSSNAFAAGLGSLAFSKAVTVLDRMQLIYCLSLEGLNGNVAPITSVLRASLFCVQSSWLS